MITLNIPNVTGSPKANKSVGWCAETCIQMALAYYGVEISEKHKQSWLSQPSRPYMDETMWFFKRAPSNMFHGKVKIRI